MRSRNGPYKSMTEPGISLLSVLETCSKVCNNKAIGKEFCTIVRTCIAFKAREYFKANLSHSFILWPIILILLLFLGDPDWNLASVSNIIIPETESEASAQEEGNQGSELDGLNQSTSAVKSNPSTAAIPRLVDQNASLLNVSLTRNQVGIDAPDYADLKVLAAQTKDGKTRRKRRNHMCIYCKTEQTHLKRHMLAKHKNEKEVQKAERLTASKPKSRAPMKKLLHVGDFDHYNTNKDNNQGNLRVARAPRSEKSADNYTACPECKGMFSVVQYRSHITRCTGISGLGCRNLAAIGRKMTPNCHAVTGNRMRHEILNRMRQDKVVRAIKYDELVMTYGNQRCSHLREQHHKENICVQLRRLGRLKVALGVKNFSDMLIPAKSESVVAAIEDLSIDKEKNPLRDRLNYPT